MTTKEDILKKIIARKRQITAEKQQRVDISLLIKRTEQGNSATPRPFQKSLISKITQEGIAVIAELKKASPSKGLLCPQYNPTIIAAQYEKAGAACLSVLTDTDFFLGCDQDLIMTRQSSSLPVLRKDFIVDPYQIYESRLLGADCMLLIAAALTATQLKDFYQLANKIGLEVLIEVSNEKELELALATGGTLIGINNRNLHDFSVNLHGTIQLKESIPKDKIVICESGIKDRGDIEYMHANDVHAFLVGEALVTAPSPGEKLAQLLGKV